MFFQNHFKTKVLPNYFCGYISKNKEIKGELHYNGQICRCYIIVKSGLTIETIYKNSVTDKWLLEIMDFLLKAGISLNKLYFIIKE